MTKESVTKVENMEWRDGHYTGEVSDGVPHGRGEFDRNKPVEYRPGRKGSSFFDDADEYLGQVRITAQYDVESLTEYDVDRHSYTWVGLRSDPGGDMEGTRHRILQQLQKKTNDSVGGLAGSMGLAPATIRRHLDILQRDRLVAFE